MYDAPFTLLTSLGWLLAGIAAVLGATRAVLVGVRAGGPARPLDAALTTATAVAVAELVVVLGAILVTGLR